MKWWVKKVDNAKVSTPFNHSFPVSPTLRRFLVKIVRSPTIHKITQTTYYSKVQALLRIADTEKLPSTPPFKQQFWLERPQRQHHSLIKDQNSRHCQSIYASLIHYMRTNLGCIYIIAEIVFFKMLHFFVIKEYMF